jgi:hypothetical protein
VVVDGGEVVDALVVDRVEHCGLDLDVCSGAGAEPHAGFEVGGFDPSTGAVGDPEGVFVGGDHRSVCLFGAQDRGCCDRLRLRVVFGAPVLLVVGVYCDLLV